MNFINDIHAVCMNSLVQVAILAAMFFLLAWMALSVPVVEWSWTTGQCVRVIPPDAGTCNRLPGHYARVWVR